jgi:hypothetical protein
MYLNNSLPVILRIGLGLGPLPMLFPIAADSRTPDIGVN